MKGNSGLCALCAILLTLGVATARAQVVSRIDIKHVGPPAASDEVIRGYIRVKPGSPYLPAAVDDDVRNLYATGLFYNVRVTQERAETTGIVLTYVVQGKLRLTDLKLQGNKKIKESKLRKKITSKVGEPLDERKLFTDSQALQEYYQKKGYPGTTVRTIITPIEESGRGSVVFEIKESTKIKIERVEFPGAAAFPEKLLRKQIKTRKRWMFSWITGSGYFKDEQFEDDKGRLTEFYRDRGYIDFEIKDVQFENPTPKTMVIRFHVSEGRQYKVGKITFQGTTMLPTNVVSAGFKPGPAPEAKVGPERRAWNDQMNLYRNFPMRENRLFTQKGLARDIEAIENFYGSKGHIDVTQSSGNLRVTRVPNTETGTMDLQFKIEEGQVSYIEKIEIKGNVKTKDKVIRRELAVSPGEVFNMVSVKLSKRRLEGLQFFEPGSVEARPEPTDPPIVGRKNLVVGVVEKNTGNLNLGAGFSSVDSIVGFVEVAQENFDIDGVADLVKFKSPTFTGGGQKLRLRIQVGTERQDYILSFIEPWFLERKLTLGVSLYHNSASYLSVEDIYSETITGARVSLTRALGSDFLIGSVFYQVQNVGIDFESGIHGDRYIPGGPVGPGGGAPVFDPANAPASLLAEEGYSLLTSVGGTLAYDTRNSTFLPDAGQRTELLSSITSEYLGGERNFYKLDLSSAWYFRGLAKGHVLEFVAKLGVVDGLQGDDVPFYEKWYLGGLYSLRGYEYRSVSPRDPGFDEPVGGQSYWFGSLEYSIPIIQSEKAGGVRFAVFYDIGNVLRDAYDFTFSDYTDNWGVGLRLNLPIGPLRLDYGIPISHDQYNSSSGKFQFGVGWQRPF